MGCKPDEAPKKRFSLLQKSTGEIYEPLMSASTRTVGSSCGGEDGAEPWWKRGTAAAAAAMMMHRDDDYDHQRVQRVQRVALGGMRANMQPLAVGVVYSCRD
jgi:hypothetical protein